MSKTRKRKSSAEGNMDGDESFPQDPKDEVFLSEWEWLFSV